MTDMGRKFSRHKFKIASVVTLLMCAMATSGHAAEPNGPPDLVAVKDIDATILQDMRYAGSNNFVGHPLPGYENAECRLRRAAAMALGQVQRDLATKRLSLKVFDCYRPVRAVNAMAEWANDGKPAGANKRFFPRIDKSRLFPLGYIASRSEHSLGIAVDLSIVDLSVPEAKPVNVPQVPCTAPSSERGPADGIDMGTSFDCFDIKSHTANAGITGEQKQRRLLLVDAMRKRGFVNYSREWWHYSYRGGASR